MWAWIVLACVWAVAVYQSWHSWQRGRMAEPANPIAAFAGRVRVAIGYVIGFAILLAGSMASFTIASAHKNEPATWAAGGSAALAALGIVAVWRRFWKMRRPRA
ncbi:MAG: hypothetical protein HYY17_03430 [Planctomycetes bacterium]|nr:hypothetical protein [Planctomycetota bacterium]